MSTVNCYGCFKESNHLKHLNNDEKQFYSKLVELNMSSVSGCVAMCSECHLIMHKCLLFKRRCITVANLLTCKENTELTNIEIRTKNSLLPILVYNCTIKSIKDDVIHVRAKKIKTKVKNNKSTEGLMFIDVEVKSVLSQIKIEQDFNDDECKNENEITFIGDDTVLNEGVNESGDESMNSVDDMMPLKELREKTTELPYFERIAFKEPYVDIIYFTPEQMLKQHTMKSETALYRENKYKCHDCFKGYATPETYNNHYNLCHNQSIGEFVCDICKCRKCSKKQIKAHILTSHLRIYKCKQCGFLSKSTSQARAHESFHEGKMYQCELCGKTFSHISGHRSHVRERHASLFICPQCGENFLSQQGLKIHVRKRHFERMEIISKSQDVITDKSLYCDSCHVQFLYKDAFYRHMLTSSKHNTNLQCCDEQFDKPSTYRSHVHQKHGLLLINRRMSMYRHWKHGRQSASRAEERKSHGGRMKAGRPPVAHRDPSKPLSRLQTVYNAVKVNAQIGKRTACETCGRLVLMEVLEHHMKGHSSKRRVYSKTQYACELCGKIFKAPSFLRKHIDGVHLKLRPYSCTQCDKTFKQQWSLHEHMQRHTGIKLYHCQECDKSYNQGHTLKVHIQREHQGIVIDKKKYTRAANNVS